MTRGRSTSRGSHGSRKWRPAARPRVPALGYASVPASQALDGPEVEAQRERIEDACRQLGLDLIDLVRDHEVDGSDTVQGPGLLYALERIDAGEASCLVVSDLRRLAGSAGGLAAVLDRLERENGRLVAVDLGLDTDTAAGGLAISRRPGIDPTPTEPPATAPGAFETSREADQGPDPDVTPAAPEEVAGAEEAAAEAIAAPQSIPQAAEGSIAPADAAEPPAGGIPAVPPPVAPAQTEQLMRALGYASIPADGDEAAVAALEEQSEVIERACRRLGIELVEIVREREPRAGKALERAGVSYLIERLAAGDANCLIVSGLDRLSHSVAELGTLVQWLEQSKLRLVAVELDLDTLTPAGQATARALASVGGWERDRLSERTRKGLAAARAKRRTGGGATEPDWTAIRKRIALMRADGMTLQAIADVLNEEGVPTPRGGVKWRPSSVQTAAGYKRRSRAKGVDDLPVAKPADSTGKPGTKRN
jgi:DNA invertase Pin-like site-specific DNA recombinase